MGADQVLVACRGESSVALELLPGFASSDRTAPIALEATPGGGRVVGRGVAGCRAQGFTLDTTGALALAGAEAGC